MKKRIFCYIITVMFLMMSVLSTSSVSNANTLYISSSWASQKITISKTVGITPEGFNALPFTQSITRREFCELLINTCRIFGIALPELSASHPFTDTNEFVIENAYMLGLVQGTSMGIFSPNLSLTREMAAVILSRLRILFQSTTENNNEYIDWNNVENVQNYERNHDYHNNRNHFTIENIYGTVSTTSTGTLTYTQPMDEKQSVQLLADFSVDGKRISAWAQPYMADVFSRGILSNTDQGSLSPKDNITREQAAVSTLNVLTYCDESSILAAGINECVLPSPSGIFISESYNEGDVYLLWSNIPLASAYDITIYKNGKATYATRISTNYIDLRTSLSNYNRISRFSALKNITNPLYSSIFGSDKTLIHASLKVVPVSSNGNPSVFSLIRNFTIDPWVNKNEMIYGDPVKISFASVQEATKNMTSIKVKVWHKTILGIKIPSSLTLTLNKNVAENMKKIFADIYNGKEKFPIKSSSAFSYRSGTSEHSCGTAVDINPEENYFIGGSGVIKAGTLWQPGKNPYSILSDGDVVRAFKKHGWYWSPDMHWSNGADYMHFSLMGT